MVRVDCSAAGDECASAFWGRTLARGDARRWRIGGRCGDRRRLGPDADAIARFAVQSGGSVRPAAAAVLADRPDLVIALGRGPEAATRLAWLIEQDIPILADKPIGLSHADVAPLADAAHRRNRFVAVALVNRIAGVIEALGDSGRDRTCLFSHRQWTSRAAIATGACRGCWIRSRAAAARCAISGCTASMRF